MTEPRRFVGMVCMGPFYCKRGSLCHACQAREAEVEAREVERALAGDRCPKCNGWGHDLDSTKCKFCDGTGWPI